MISIPNYAPKFSHTDWIDNEDRVQAGGENGFNIRFHNLESEFASLASVLNPLIGALAKQETCLSLVPILAPSKQVDQPATPPLTPQPGQPLPPPRPRCTGNWSTISHRSRRRPRKLTGS
ncbi:hypothetical protein [Streptomyces endophytica]|uniref:Uncharacterized protein n=1 Tax=Streptomyces endophytica TaxID=2991496 RepID=A0ABY6PI69_9ACTN|nr:hypothetical protein [Streptomyces endophytica]UZJ33140.1 hypothetical protein OJ254_26245 [Streptomyces endophytica]